MDLREKIAIINEQKFKSKLETYKTYLYNALTIIQERELFEDKDLREYAKKELGINTRDFNKIMGKEFGK